MVRADIRGSLQSLIGEMFVVRSSLIERPHVVVARA